MISPVWRLQHCKTKPAVTWVNIKILQGHKVYACLQCHNREVKPTGGLEPVPHIFHLKAMLHISPQRTGMVCCTFLNSCGTICNICLPGFLLWCISTTLALESSWGSSAVMKLAGAEGSGVGYSGVAFYPGMTWVKGFYAASWSDEVHQRKQKSWSRILMAFR